MRRRTCTAGPPAPPTHPPTRLPALAHPPTCPPPPGFTAREFKAALERAGRPEGTLHNHTPDIFLDLYDAGGVSLDAQISAEQSAQANETTGGAALAAVRRRRLHQGGAELLAAAPAPADGYGLAPALAPGDALAGLGAVAAGGAGSCAAVQQESRLLGFLFDANTRYKLKPVLKDTTSLPSTVRRGLGRSPVALGAGRSVGGARAQVPAAGGAQRATPTEGRAAAGLRLHARAQRRQPPPAPPGPAPPLTRPPPSAPPPAPSRSPPAPDHRHPSVRVCRPHRRLWPLLRGRLHRGHAGGGQGVSPHEPGLLACWAAAARCRPAGTCAASACAGGACLPAAAACRSATVRTSVGSLLSFAVICPALARCPPSAPPG